MGIVITSIGLEKIASATIENPLKLTHFSVGDGGGNPIDPNESMTSLVNEKYRTFINNKYLNRNNSIFECIIRPEATITEDIYIRELGVFDEAGNLIIITDIPVHLRPATGSINVETLWFNISIQISNTESVVIEVKEQAFATVDALQRLTNMVNELSNTTNELITSRNNFINSCVGIEKWFNTDNQYKGQNLVKVGVKTYALMETGNILNIADYQTAFNNCGAVDNGDGTFQVPIMHPNSTTKHILSINTRELGTYEEDAMEKIQGSISNYAAMTDLYTSTPAIILSDATTEGVFKLEDNSSGVYQKLASNNLPNNPWAGTEIAASIIFDNSLVARTDTETRMKNTAGQWYLLVKIDL